MDVSWIRLPNDHSKYIDGCLNFLELAKENLIEGKTKCPCKTCKLRYWLTLDEVEGHILFKGFYQNYTNWIWHGKRDVREHLTGVEAGNTSEKLFVGRDDMEGLLNVTSLFNASNCNGKQVNEIPFEGHQNQAEFNDVSDGDDIGTELSSDDELNDELNNVDSDSEFESQNDHDSYNESNQASTPKIQEQATYKRLIDAAKEVLYEGCQAFSKLSFLLHLFHIKCMFHWSNESFNKLIELLLEAFPHIKEFPTSYYEGKKIINGLGLGYEKIHACPNNCMLYWGDFSKKEKCHVCHTSRYKTVIYQEGNNTKEDENCSKRGEAAKVVRYFPLIPRLKRIYMSSKTAENMHWHHKDRVKDGKLRHPADGLAWQEFDSRYPKFASDPRSVRLALASDGFNPYRLMNTTYSTWPIILIPYNLPPWLCMKPSSFILSCIIPGKSSPGIDIDVYLQPLLYELKLLWKGVDAFDAYEGKNFLLRAALHSTINDFPAYAMLSGWSTTGYEACPRCTHSTNSGRFGNTICYVGHRKWLPHDHPYRSQGDLFDGTNVYDSAPKTTTGSDILRQQEDIDYVYGKTTKRPKRKSREREVGVSTNFVNYDDDKEESFLWNKKSVFFKLPYWEHNPLRHNLDVMHIEKNVCDNILGTLLDMDKSRDSEKARRALENLGVKKHLWLQDRPNREPFMPPASYSMSNEEKERFLKVLQRMRVPDGYSSNISRCVNMKQRKLFNLKSHDNHVLLQDILPVALRASQATKVIDLLGELSSFFKYLCSPTLDCNELDVLESKIVIILCRMEMEFLPTFFTIMVHLLIHLVEEARLGGPVQYRWMYPIERYLAHLKSYVSNKAQPEGSIAEGFMLEETITFCSRYLNGIETIFNRTKRNDDDIPNKSLYLYHSGGRVIGMKEKVRLEGIFFKDKVPLDVKNLKQMQRYVLLHSDEMKEVLDEFINQKRQQSSKKVTIKDENEWVVNEFADWLQSTLTEPSLKQKPSLIRRTPVHQEIKASAESGSIRRPPRPSSSSHTSSPSTIAGRPSGNSTLRPPDSSHPSIKTSERAPGTTLQPSNSAHPLIKTSERAPGSTLRPSNSAHPLIKTNEGVPGSENHVCPSTITSTHDTALKTDDPTTLSTLHASGGPRKTNILNSAIPNKKYDTLSKSMELLQKEGKTSAPPQRNHFGLARGGVSSNVSQPFKPRRLGLMPDWPDDVQFDEKEEVLTIDMEGNYKSVSTSVQPHDVWHSNGVKFFVTFNEFYQPLRRGGHILIKFIGDVAKTESLCPIRETNWRRVNEQYKVDIIKIIRAHFVIPDGDCYDQAILKRTGKSLRQYRHHLKVSLFKPATKTKAQLYDSGPVGHPRASWIYLVDYWSSTKGKELAECGKEARASQDHTHITGSKSYANIRADFEEENKREPSHFEIFGLTHRRKDGTFADEHFTEDLLAEVDDAVQTEIDCNPSVAKSRVVLENETFNKIMYGDEVPERPVGFGFGVNKSDIFGVRGLLREERICVAKNETLAFQNMEKDMADLKVENKILKTQHNENTQLLKTMTTQFSQIIEIFSTGKATPEFLNIAKTMIDSAKSQIPNASNEEGESS